MMWKKTAVITFGILLLCLLTVILMFFYINSLDGKEISSLSFDLITKTHFLNTELNIENIYVNGTEAYECQSEDWWLATLDMDSIESGSQPEINVNTSQEGRHVAILRNEITPDFIENDESVLIIVYSLKSYNIYRLRFTTLPIMVFNTDGVLTLEKNEVPVEFNGNTGYAHIRGQSSKVHDKKSYTLTLDEKHTFLGMRKDDDWILYAGSNDQERIRNVFSSNLWYNTCAGNNAFGIINGYEYRYIELFINDSYSGLYALGYKPDQKQFHIQNGEYLFSKIEWGEHDYELHGSKTKENSTAAWNALNSDYLYDEASSIDLWLFTNLCAATDNAGKNYYVALKRNCEGTLTAVYSPWDLDLSWGNNDNAPSENFYTVSPDVPYDMTEGFVYKCLSNGDQKIIEKIQTRYAELRNKGWSKDSLLNMLSEYEDMIFNSGAYRRDTSRWAESTQQDPELKLSLFKEYLLNRLKWMDDYIATL